MSDYGERALKYAYGVVWGDLNECKFVQQASERFIKNLEDAKTGNFPYLYNPHLANKPCSFIERLPHIKGKWARERRLIELEDWQLFIICNAFGWVDHNQLRRFKTVYTEIPRKNAKSTLSSGVGLYCTHADDEPGAEVYSAATTRDQARIVFQDSKRMAERSQWLKDEGLSTSAKAIYNSDSSSTFQALSRDQGGNLDGLNVHCGIIDELHAHKTRDVFDVIETATGAREQPLLWLITTAGFNRAGICYEQRSYVSKVLSGAVEDEEYFGIIYTIDDDDDWTDPKNWEKANPNWGKSVNPDDIARKARKAMEMAAAQNNFLTKHLNVWVNADTAWMDMRAWEKRGKPEITLDDFEGKPCFIAGDLATKKDINSIALVFPEENKLTVFVKHYLPEYAIETEANSQYSGWEIEGRLISTPGNVIDFETIEADLEDFAARFDVQDCVFDPWQAQQLINSLNSKGLACYEFRQTVANMSEPMKMLEAMVLDDTLTHDGCPVTTWMISNVVAHLDAKENIYPRKEFPENKIDGAVAVIMAVGRWLQTQQDQTVYDDRGLLFV